MCQCFSASLHAFIFACRFTDHLKLSGSWLKTWTVRSSSITSISSSKPSTPRTSTSWLSLSPCLSLCHHSTSSVWSQTDGSVSILVNTCYQIFIRQWNTLTHWSVFCFCFSLPFSLSLWDSAPSILPSPHLTREVPSTHWAAGSAATACHCSQELCVWGSLPEQIPLLQPHSDTRCRARKSSPSLHVTPLSFKLWLSPIHFLIFFFFFEPKKKKNIK